MRVKTCLVRATAQGGSGPGPARLALGVMTAGAYLGGHLSLGKGIGVNHAAFEPPISSWTPMMAEQELPGARPGRSMSGRTR
jgi:hypothetical protein